MEQAVQIDDEVRLALENHAVEHRMVFRTENDVLRHILGLDDRRQATTASLALDRESLSAATAEATYPQSHDPGLQSLLDALRPTIFQLSPTGMHQKGRYWVANPNTVTLQVRDARAHHLAVTIYGEPDEFPNSFHTIALKRDRNSYSGFFLSSIDQTSDASDLIMRSYELKQSRGRH